MVAFKTYLRETPRPLERAIKLGSYLAKRSTKRTGWEGSGHFITLKGYDHHKTSEVYGKMDTHMRKSRELPFKKDHPVTDVDVHKLHPTQHTTDFNANYSREKKSKDDRPIRVIHHKGKHYIMDGHHRWMHAKLEGKKTIKAQVLHLEGVIPFGLFEAVRSIERATKLGDYIAKRYSRTGDFIKDSSYKHRHAAVAAATLPKLFMPAKRQSIPVKDAKATQPGTWFTKSGAHAKMQDKKPIKILKLGNRHYVVDGHHRLMAAKLRGDTHIDADVH